jgi:uncharacterized protein
MSAPLEFIWRDDKNRRNKAKHGVGFETAERVFDDPFHLSIQDRHEDGEERRQTLGLVGPVVLLVAHTFVEETDREIVHVISARRATKRERDAYTRARSLSERR